MELALLIPILAIIGGFLITIIAIWTDYQTKKMKLRGTVNPMALEDVEDLKRRNTELAERVAELERRAASTALTTSSDADVLESNRLIAQRLRAIEDRIEDKGAEARNTAPHPPQRGELEL